MECPYCNGEMEQGWIRANEVLFWATKGHVSYYDQECIARRTIKKLRKMEP